jgi:hypothetical protein
VIEKMVPLTSSASWNQIARWLVSSTPYALPRRRHQEDRDLCRGSKDSRTPIFGVRRLRCWVEAGLWPDEI